MGDISELRGLIITISTLSCIVLLILWLPAPDFAESIIEARQYSTPEDFDITEIIAYNDTYSLTFNYTMDMPYHIDADESGIGHDLWLQLDKYWISLDHFWYWFFIPVGFHDMEWYDTSHSEKISYQEAYMEKLDMETLDIYDYGSIFWMECEHLQLKIVFSYNTTMYASHFDAFDNEALTMSVGVEWELEKTTYNAWDLIAMLLFYNFPETHWMINAILKVPIWVCIAYLSYVLIIKVIPLIAGG